MYGTVFYSIVLEFLARYPNIFNKNVCFKTAILEVVKQGNLTASPRLSGKFTGHVLNNDSESCKDVNVTSTLFILIL